MREKPLAVSPVIYGTISVCFATELWPLHVAYVNYDRFHWTPKVMLGVWTTLWASKCTHLPPEMPQCQRIKSRNRHHFPSRQSPWIIDAFDSIKLICRLDDCLTVSHSNKCHFELKTLIAESRWSIRWFFSATSTLCMAVANVRGIEMVCERTTRIARSIWWANHLAAIKRTGTPNAMTTMKTTMKTTTTIPNAVASQTDLQNRHQRNDDFCATSHLPEGTFRWIRSFTDQACMAQSTVTYRFVNNYFPKLFYRKMKWLSIDCGSGAV